MPAALALFFGLALSMGLFVIVSNLREQRIAEEFDRRAGNVLTFLSDGLAAHFEALYALRDFFHASTQIDKAEFDRFVENPLERHPGLRSLAWAPQVRDPARSAFEAAATEIVGQPYQIKELRPDGEVVPSPRKPTYTPITFISPEPKSHAVLGMDLQSNPARNSELERARRTRALATTPWVDLVSGGSGFLAILPLFPEEPATTELIPGTDPGVVIGTVEIDEMFAVTVGRLEERIDFIVFESAPAGGSPTTLHYDGTQRQLSRWTAGDTLPGMNTDFQLRATLDVGGQLWVFHFFPSPGFLQVQRTIEHWLTLGIGIVLTLLLTGYLLLSIRRTEQIAHVNEVLEAEIDERTRVQTKLQQSDDAHRFLAEASSILVSSLDYEATLRKVAHLAVPDIADWCLVHVLEPNGRVRRLEVTGKDPALAERLRAALLRRPQPQPDADDLILRALRTGEPQLSHDAMADLSTNVSDEELMEIVREIDPRVAFAVPLVARDRTLGTLTFVTSEEDGLGPRARALLEELGRRAALHVDNARLYEDAQTASQSKSDFLAVMSHELRTPLNAIMGYADLLLIGVPEAPTEEQRRQLERINASARHLLDLIEEILTYSRTEAGHEEVHAEPLDLTDLLDEILEGAERSAATRDLALERDLPESPVHVVSDPAKIRQIVANLLSNAIKFTEAGKVGVRMKADEDEVRIEVWDTGIGITSKQLADLFEPFWQAADPTTRTAGGTGLGLTVSRRLARLLGGDITVESEPGEGSTFTLILPRNYDERGVAAETRTSATPREEEDHA